MQDRVLLLASHGGLAEGMRDTAAMVLGEFPCEVRTYSLLPGMNAQDAVATLREEVERRPQTEFVILTDVYGASVFTAFCQLLRYSNVRLFCGMNAAIVAVQTVLADGLYIIIDKLMAYLRVIAQLYRLI